MVEITTRSDLSRLNSLYLVHPWLDTLLEHEDIQSGILVEDDTMPQPFPDNNNEEICDDEIDGDSLSLPEPELPSFPTPV